MHVKLSSADEADTFYAGDYELDQTRLNINSNTPQYKKSDNTSILLYCNSDNTWVLGDINHNDLVFRLSNNKHLSFSPTQWTEWNNNNTNNPEIPNLVLKNATFLPPLHIKLEPNEPEDKTFYGGFYTLDVSERYPPDTNSMPQFVKDSNQNIRLYVNTSISSWVLGTANHKDYLFRLSSPANQESPVNWTNWTWDVESSLEQPVLRLKDPTELPPLHIKLQPHLQGETPLYAGDYMLDYQNANFARYQKDDDQTILYFNKEKKWWKLGDSSIDYIFNDRSHCRDPNYVASGSVPGFRRTCHLNLINFHKWAIIILWYMYLFGALLIVARIITYIVACCTGRQRR